MPWNDPEAVEAALAEHEVAAILAEPLPANMGLVPPDDGLPRASCASSPTQHGALLVLDEVISGFRVARGGAQELLGVEADLTMMGKVIGGGLPAAAYGGRRDADAADRPGRRRLPGGNALGQPARGRRRAGDARAARRRRLRAPRRARPSCSRPACARRPADRPVQVVSVPGLVTPFFSAEPSRDFAGAAACDHDAYGRFCRALLDRGVYPPASQFEAWFVSLAHDEAAIEHTCDAAAEAFAAAFDG